jgi:tartrate dehydrogenase/decarboxylase/D-malate dehydrogenase
MMLDHLGATQASDAIVWAIEQVLGQADLRTQDLGGTADTKTCGKAIADAVLHAP